MVHLTRRPLHRGISRPRPDTTAVPPPRPAIAPHQKRAMGKVVAAQCFGMLTVPMLSGGLLLLYLNALGAPPARIVALLALGPFLSALFGLPVAWLSDRTGIKVFGAWGNGLIVAGMALIAASGSFRPLGAQAVVAVLVTGLAVHTLGSALFNSGWFSLLTHVVPPHVTGRFFSLLRASWQGVAIVFFAVSAAFFSRRTPVEVYQILFALGAAAVALRGVFYRDIPEAPRFPGGARSFGSTVGAALRLPGLARYLAYLLLLVAVTGNAADMLRLSAARGSGFGDDQVLLLSVAGMIGSLCGFGAAGFLADRLGAARVFFVCHFAFAAVLALFPLRHVLPLPPLWVGIAAAGLLGACTASLGIAIITQSFATCLGPGRTMALALVQAVQTLGAGLGGFLLAGCLAALQGRTVAPAAEAVPAAIPYAPATDAVHGRGGIGALGGLGGLNAFDLVLLGLSAFVLFQAAWHRLLPRRRAVPHVPQGSAA